ncbi:hypothetical protein ANO11243_036520 [Dothideomycetidae sp. 11243]|nr:hypothetical protein ANO11243_036520 [fungal sp. No.11243]
MEPPLVSRLRQSWSYNLATLRRQPLAELSGSLGDLGTLLPLMLALAQAGSISLPATLVISGLANILTGLAFGIPLPVQPMKAIASIALASSYTREETVAAGLSVAAAVGFLSITGLLRVFTHIVPVAVVRGIQVGAGLSLVISAGTGMLQPLGWTAPSWADNRLWALGGFFILLFAHLRPAIPAALLLTATGLLLASATQHTHDRQGHIIWHPDLVVPSPATFRHAALHAGLPQLPLTLLNSVLAASSLAAALDFPSYPSTTSLGISVAAFNLVGAWTGAMPICHGSGGLAAQYRFGARSGASVIVLGLVKLLLGLFAAGPLLALLGTFPAALLAVMVLAAGVELARVAADLSDQHALWGHAADQDGERGPGLDEGLVAERWLVMLVTAAGCLAFKNDAVGFAAGMVWHWGVVANRKVEQKGGTSWWRQRQRRRSTPNGERQALLGG